MNFPFLSRPKSAEQLEEENHRLEGEVRQRELQKQIADLNFSIDQKREMDARLKAHGLTKKTFGGNYSKIFEFLKHH